MALKNTWTTGEQVTATDLNNTANEILGINAAGVFASRPTVGHLGRTYDCTDNGNRYRDNGTTWDLTSVAGTGIAGVEPPAATWTTSTLGTATIAADKGGRLLTAPTASGLNYRLEYRTLTPTSNYTATSHISLTAPYVNSVYCGLLVRNSSSGSFVAFGPSMDSVAAADSLIRCQKWTNATTFSAEYGTPMPARQTSGGKMPNWFRIRDDATNRYYEYSQDGIDWQVFTSSVRTDFITPDQVGWGASNNNGTTALLRLKSFVVA